MSLTGGYSSGQRGRTVNPLGNLRRFESCSPHTIEKRFFIKSLKTSIKPAILVDLQVFLFRHNPQNLYKYSKLLWQVRGNSITLKKVATNTRKKPKQHIDLQHVKHIYDLINEPTNSIFINYKISRSC